MVIKNIKITEMKKSGGLSVIVLLILTAIPFTDSFSQNPAQKPSKKSALDAFEKGNYELAGSQYSELSASYPKDPVYKYFNGVCLVKLNRDPAKAAVLLREAVLASAAMRSVPADGLFYLGRAQQMGGRFDEAIKSYNKFTELAGKKAAKELDVPVLIKQCGEKKGQIAPAVSTVREEKKTDSVRNKPVELVKVPESKVPRTETSAQPAEKVSYSYDQLLSQALAFQVKSDSLARLAAGYRQELTKAENSAKGELKVKIQDFEEAAASNQKMADNKMAEARKLAGKPGETKPDTISAKPLIKEIPAAADTIRKPITENRPVVIKDTTVAVKDTIAAVKEKQGEIKIAPPAVQKVMKDTLPKPQLPEKAPISAETGKPVFSVFGIDEKPVYTADEKVQVNPDVPAGLIYRIQVAVFRNPVAPSFFKGINPVFGFKNETTGVSNYYAGMFRTLADAGKAVIRVKALGFKDAFVVALLDKKVVSSDRAAILEKEWGSKPLFIENPEIPDAVRDTIPPTLVFRVEVTRSAKPLPVEQTDNIKKMSGNRGFDIFVSDTKQNVYLIGKFLTFKSASEYADLLVRNGFKDTKVVAYLGFREIPVDVAQQLFEEK